MAGESQIFDLFSDLSSVALKDTWLPYLNNVAFKRKRSWMANKIRRSSGGVKALKKKIPFITAFGASWRPMSETGYTPTGSKDTYASQEFELGCHAATVQVTHKAILATEGDESRIGDIISHKMKGISEAFPFYYRSALWSPESGVLGIASSCTANVVTLSNTGLWNTIQQDRTKCFWPHMYVQVYTSAGARRGDPVRLTAIDAESGTITLASDPGVASGDMFTVADIAGLENAYNQSSVGIYDVIDDDNTFQTVNRATSGNEWAQALVKDNSGTLRAITRALILQFFHDLYDPEFACTHWKVIEKYWNECIADQVRYTQTDMVKDGYREVTIGKTRLVEDDDHDRDKITVPDLANMYVTEHDRGIHNLFDQGWRQIDGRPFMEYVVVYWMRLVAEDCRYMGVLKDLQC